MKIIGLWMVSLGIQYLWGSSGVIISAIQLRLMGEYTSMQLSINRYLIWSGIYLLSAILCFVFAWLLIFKTDWIADKMRVSKDENPCTPLEKSTLFPMGIQLLGGYFLLTAVPSFLYAIASSYRIGFDKASASWEGTIAGLPWMGQICLAVICIFKADAIVQFIANKANVKWIKIIVCVLVTLLALIAITRIIIKATIPVNYFSNL